MSEIVSYKLVKADNATIATTRDNWISQANKLDDFGVMVADDVNNIFDSLEPETNDNEYTYFLIKNSETHGRAFLKIMHAAPHRRSESWLKLLKIRLEPDLNLEGKEAKSGDDASAVFEVLAAAIFESINLIFVKDIRTVKIYGRTEEMRIMFLAILTNEPLKNFFPTKALRLAKKVRGSLSRNKDKIEDKMDEKQPKRHFEYNERDIKVLASAIENACLSVGCDLRCFDWMCYNPDFYRKQENKKAA